MDNVFFGESVYRILYFSGTGNTFYVVEKIKEKLQEKGFDCKAVAADQLQADCGREPGKEPDSKLMKQKLRDYIDEASTLILSYPVYASDIPVPLKQLLPLLPKGKMKDLAVVATVHLAGGDACLLPGKYLEKRDYNPVLATYIKMPNNLKVPGFDFVNVENGEKLDPYFVTTGKSIDEIVRALETHASHIEGKGIANYLLGAAQRMGENFIADSLAKSMYVTPDCIKCGLCVSSCPMGNITMEGDLPVFGDRCCLCTRCYNFCPASAIQFSDKTIDKEKFPRYKGFNNWKPPRIREVEVVSPE